MGVYTKLRRFSSDVYVYKFNPSIERLDTTVGEWHKLERLSTINGEPMKGEVPIAKINGGFFAMNGSTEYIGSFVDEGLYYNGSSYYYPTLIYWKKDNKLTIENRPDQNRHGVYQKEAWWAVGVPWTLIIDGKKNFQYDKQTLIKVFGHPYIRASRTLLGQKKDGTIVMAVIDGRRVTSLGITIEQSASLMQELGCYIAVNLDGGGSSEMIVNDVIVNKPSDGSERYIGTAFIVYAKKTTDELRKSSTKVVTASALNVRSGPGVSYNKVGILFKGDTVSVLATYNNGWCRINYDINSYGYVNSSYLK